jgi:O-antigen ligase
MNSAVGENEAVSAEAPLWLVQLVRALVFLFPITVATVGWGSAIFMLLLLPALYYGRGWSSLGLWERRLLIGYLVAFAVMSLSLVNAEELREGMKALERYLRFVLIIPIYLMFRRFGFSMGREVAAGALLGCLAMGAQAYYQVKIIGYPVAEGYYHKIVFGDLAVWWAAVTALLAVSVVRGGLWRLALLLAIGAALYASALSQTRGAWLFVPFIPVILLWAHWKRMGIKRNWLIVAVAVSMIAVIGVGMQSESLKQGVQRGINELEAFQKNPGERTSWGLRLNMWRNTLLILKEHPIIGTGAGDFQADMKHMVEDGRSWNPYVVKYGHAHSIYFDTLAKGGILGFVATVTAFLLMPLIAFIRGLRSAERSWERFYAIGGVMLVAAYATFGISEGLWSRNPFVNTYVVSLLVFLAGMVNSREQADAELDKRL